MEEYGQILILAALPVLGNFSGSLLAETFSISPRTLSAALHLAAGCVLAMVGIELMPQALTAHSPWMIVLAFIAGCAFFVLLDKGMDVVEARLNKSATNRSVLAIYFATFMDLFTDGVMIGAGATVSMGLGLLLALGQVVADVPEGFAMTANFKAAGTPRSKRLLLAAAFAIPAFLGASIGYWALRDAPQLYQFLLLAFTAGILLTVSVEEMIVEAHKVEDTSFMPLFLGAGFGLFALITVYLG